MISNNARQFERNTSGDAATTLMLAAGAFALGAAVMYLFDPQLGDGRRSQLADQLAATARRSGRRAGGWSEDVTQELQAVPHEMQYRASDGDAPDEVVAARVRSELGHAVQHAGGIDVRVTDGTVTLSGPVLADEAVGVLATVQTVPGVKSVEDRLDVHQSADSIPSLQS